MNPQNSLLKVVTAELALILFIWSAFIIDQLVEMAEELKPTGDQ